MDRRTFITGTAAGATLLAGCSGVGMRVDDDPAPDNGTDDTPTDDGPYTVEMAPVGKVTFDAPPESVAHFFPDYADMAVALGHGDSINSVGFERRYYTSYYDELDGVGVDEESMTQLQTRNGLDKEVFYELDSDLHMIDPEWLINNGYFGLEAKDIDRIADGIAPFLGNTIFRRTDKWHDYRYYSMYEAFEKVAEVYREKETFEAFRRFHDEFLASVRANLPASKDRPEALLCWSGVNEPVRFYPYRMADQGTNKKQFHDLGLEGALVGTDIEGLSVNQRAMFDYETMLEVDPDSILLRGHETKTREEFEETVLAYMRNHEAASQLSAVEDGRVYRGGPIYTGPIHNLFVTERFAKIYFPDRFSGDLFDRDELAAIITG